MRKYYRFNSIDTNNALLQNICVPIFCTGEVIEFQSKPLVLSEQITHGNLLRYSPDLCITPKSIQNTINATDLEILFKNPLLFYYKSIKKLEPIPYVLQEAMEAGNVVHKILERATKKIQNNEEFDFKSFILQHFTQEGLKHYITFYEDDILKILKELLLIHNAVQTVKILTETTFEYILQVDGNNFVLKSRADRVDAASDMAIIYDYKTGSDSNFQNEIKNLDKIQLLIPALCLNAKHKCGKYKFIGLGEEVTQQITQDILDSFIQKTTDILRRYFILNQPLEIGKEFYSYTHVARV
jgi:RecB family exonuclease